MEGEIGFAISRTANLPPPPVKLHLLLFFSLPLGKLPQCSVPHLYGHICRFHVPDSLVCSGGQSL